MYVVQIAYMWSINRCSPVVLLKYVSTRGNAESGRSLAFVTARWKEFTETCWQLQFSLEYSGM
jgi:hypothetical protein